MRSVLTFWQSVGWLSIGAGVGLVAGIVVSRRTFFERWYEYANRAWLGV